MTGYEQKLSLAPFPQEVARGKESGYVTYFSSSPDFFPVRGSGASRASVNKRFTA